MTLSVVYFNETAEVAARGIRCCADSLIKGDIGKLTPHAMKIFPLRISYPPDYPFIYKKSRLSHTIGFTFSGNLNAAMNSYALLSNLCEHVQPIHEHVGTLPSMQTIADLVAQIVYTYGSNYGSLLDKEGLCDVVLFGFCLASNDFKTFYIHPDLSDGKFVVRIEEINLYERQYFAIGSGSHLLKAKVDENNGRFHPNFVRDIINNSINEEVGVGGFFQRGWSNKWGMRLVCDAMQNTPLGFGAPFCGFMLSPFKLGDKHFISLPMFGDSI